MAKSAVHEALERLRQRSRGVDLYSYAELEEGKRMLSSTEKTLEQKVIDGELKGLFETAVDSLPELYRTVLVVRDCSENSMFANTIGIRFMTANTLMDKIPVLNRRLKSEGCFASAN
jgi:hypothetical protein